MFSTIHGTKINKIQLCTSRINFIIIDSILLLIVALDKILINFTVLDNDKN